LPISANGGFACARRECLRQSAPAAGAGKETRRIATLTQISNSHFGLPTDFPLVHRSRSHWSTVTSKTAVTGAELNRDVATRQLCPMAIAELGIELNSTRKHSAVETALTTTIVAPTAPSITPIVPKPQVAVGRPAADPFMHLCVMRKKLP